MRTLNLSVTDSLVVFLLGSYFPVSKEYQYSETVFSTRAAIPRQVAGSIAHTLA